MHQGPLKQAVFQPSSPDPTGGGGGDLWLLRGIRAFCSSDTSLYIGDHAQHIYSAPAVLLSPTDLP